MRLALSIIFLLLLIAILSVFIIIKFKLYTCCQSSLCTGHLTGAMTIPAFLLYSLIQLPPVKKLLMLNSVLFLLTRINENHFVEFLPPVKAKGPFAHILSAKACDDSIEITDEFGEKYTLTENADPSLLRAIYARLRRLFDESKIETA